MTILVIRPSGRLGNQMLQYVLAKSLALRGGPVEIAGYDMPEWGLVSPVPPHAPRRMPRLRGHLIDIDYVSRLIKRFTVPFLHLVGHGCRCEFYAPKETFANIFDGSSIPVAGYGPEFLVVHIRCGDIFGGRRKDYGVIAPDFYRVLARKRGKRLVFIGELEPNFYVDMLRDQFPDAIFVQNAKPVVDFEIIRRSKHIVLSTSSFAWTAAWLSGAESVDLPVIGFFDPRVRPDMNFLPTDDRRYVFHMFQNADWFGRPPDIELLSRAVESSTIAAPEVQALVIAARRKLRYRWMKRRVSLPIEVVLRRAFSSPRPTAAVRF